MTRAGRRDVCAAPAAPLALPSVSTRRALHNLGATWALSALLAASVGCDSGPGSARSHASTKPRFVRGPANGRPIAPFVKQALAEARPGERVIVYVGATWCEPCKHFHAAVQSGQLDAKLPGLVLIEQDADADREALVAAGYASPMIPLFAIPDGDGRGTSRRIFGSTKGPGAAAEIAPRLTALLSGGGTG